MSVTLEGVGLHTGLASRVRLVARDGAVTLSKGGVSARLDECFVVATDHATTVARAGKDLRVSTVEHLFASLAGLGVRDGLAIELEGDELPLLDGSAAAWTRALLGLGLASKAPALAVALDRDIEVGASRYSFRRGELRVAVTLELREEHAALVEREASWNGDAADFAMRVAPARTFAFAEDLPEMARRGLSSRADPASVVVVDRGRVHSAGAPCLPDEPARHKLLDLMGDLYLYGGPPAGSVHAHRPGHTATHTAVRRALELGVLAVQPKRSASPKMGNARAKSTSE